MISNTQKQNENYHDANFVVIGGTGDLRSGAWSSFRIRTVDHSCGTKMS